MRALLGLLLSFVLCGTAACGTGAAPARAASSARSDGSPDAATPHAATPDAETPDERAGARLVLPARFVVPPRDDGAAMSVALPWRCQGSGSLRVLGTRGDCGCARIAALPDRMQSGDRGVLRVRLARTSRSGPQRVTIRVYTDQPAPRDLVTVRLRAWVGDFLCVRAKSIDLGDVDTGFVARRTVALWQQAPAPVRVQLVGVDGTVAIRPARQPDGATILTLAMQMAPPAGPLDAHVRVVAGHHVLRLPIQGRVFVVPEAAPTPGTAARLLR